MEYAELEAVAYVGLIKGCRRYDPATGYKLSTIAVPFINGAILHWFRDRGYAVKYPSKWRELMPKARRLLMAGDAPAAVAQELNLSLSELEEMLGSMCGTSELKDEIVGEHDASVELELMPSLLALQVKAWEHMAWHDQAQISHWWKANKRRAEIPRLQLHNFRRIVRHLLEGRPLPEVREQLMLQVGNMAQQGSKPSTAKASKPRSRSKAQLDKAVVQMGLFPLTGSTPSRAPMDSSPIAA